MLNANQLNDRHIYYTEPDFKIISPISEATP